MAPQIVPGVYPFTICPMELFLSQRFSEVFSIVWCVLLLGPYGMTAPTDMFLSDPCGGHGGEGGGERRTDGEILTAIKLTAERALNTAKSFDDAYTRHLFNGRTLEETNKDFPDSKLFAISELPIKLNEPLPDAHYAVIGGRTLADNLVKQYEHLQDLYLAVEGVVLDQAIAKPDFHANYETLLNTLKQLMCEVHSAIVELGFAGRIVPRTRRPNEPITDVSYKTVYNWLIFRDYIMLMQYLIQSSNYFLNAMGK